MSDIEGSMNDVARALERLPTPEERQAEAEQRAWDGAYDKALLAILERGQLYGAGNPGAGVHSREAQSMDAAAYADAKLEQRRLRFGSGKEAGDGGEGRVSVPAGVLREAADLLAHNGPPEKRRAVANVLGALVSE